MDRRSPRFPRKSIAAACVLLLVAVACSGSSESAKPVASPVRASSRPSPKVEADAVHVAAGDIQAYWTNEFPQLYADHTYVPIPLDHIYAGGKSGVTIPNCGSAVVTPDVWEGNAFYCFGSNYIAYDARPNGLIDEIQTSFGDPAIAAVFAHEWGHAIQDRAGNTRVPTILAELQADCFSGAWVASAAKDPTDHFEPKTGDLDSILSAMLAFRDAPGSSANAAMAHGSGFDRVSSFQNGYENGADACVPYFEKPPVITEIPFTSLQEERNGGNVRAAIVLPGSVEMLNDFYQRAARTVYVPISDKQVYTFDPDHPPATLPTCGGKDLDASSFEGTVFICPSDRYVVVDTTYLQRVYDEIGDFGVTTLMAGPWAGYVQGLQGVKDAAAEDAAKRSDCYTGGFAAALVNGRLKASALHGRVQASAGDLDEAISAFIDSDRTAGASGDEVFVRVEDFRSGLLNGYESCIEGLPASPAPA